MGQRNRRGGEGGSSPASGVGHTTFDKNEAVLALLACESLLGIATGGEPGRRADLEEAYESVRPHFWLTLARTFAAVAQAKGEEAEPAELMLDMTHRWLDRAVGAGAADAHVLQAAGELLDRLSDVPTFAEEVRSELVQRAADLLRKALVLAPGRPDALCSLATALCTQAQWVEGGDRAELYREAVLHFDQAARGFPRSSRRFGEKKLLHPGYLRALSGAASARWSLARAGEDPQANRRLLLQSVRLRRAVLAKPAKEPYERLLLGMTLLDLARLDGDPLRRREQFQEAAGHLEAAAKHKEARSWDSCAAWGEAVLGWAALASGAEQQRLVLRAKRLFATSAGLAPDLAQPHRRAAEAWLRFAASASGELEAKAARGAEEAALRVNRMEPGAADYNLACALARLDRAAEAAEALTSALERDRDLLKTAVQDPDLARLWEARPELREALAGKASGSLPAGPGA